MSEEIREDDSWEVWWEARKDALEKILGPAGSDVMHSMLPLAMGGQADVMVFRPPQMGVTYVTADLIGESGQPESSLGQYELMICQRDDDQPWAPNFISQLAAYTLEATLQPWDTMTIAPALPDDANISEALFVPYAEFEVRDKKCGLLLCLGLTRAEMKYCRKNDCESIVEKLKAADEYPFTMHDRKSVL